MSRRPAVLVSFVYLDNFLRHLSSLRVRSWALDSGAFSAHNKGTIISLRRYINAVRYLQDNDERLEDVFALDVIGDGKRSLRNANRMRDAGCHSVIPTFHYGGDFADLRSWAGEWDKIALGGMAVKREGNHSQLLSKADKRRFIAESFSVVWPKRIHLFGCTDENLLAEFPAESVDSTSWHLQPSRYGLWKYQGRLPGVRGEAVRKGIPGQIKYCMDVETTVQDRWRKVHEQNQINEFSYRFAVGGAEVEYFK